MTRPLDRLKGKEQTFCTVCETDVGVTRTPFGRGYGKDEPPTPKVARHKDDGVVCRGSLLSVHENVVFPTRVP